MRLTARFINNTAEYEDQCSKAQELGINPPKEQFIDCEFHLRKEDIAAFNESTEPNYWRVFTRFGYDFTISKDSITKEELIEICQ